MAARLVPTTVTVASGSGSFSLVSVSTPQITPLPFGGGREGLSSPASAASSGDGAASAGF